MPAGPDRRSGRVHVAAGVLRDRRGRILLARRTAGRDLAGAWEFPGGKVEPGESPREALARELHEELGIRVVAAEPFIAVPQAYPAKRIVLDVFTVTAYEGTPKGREKQALAWAPPEKLAGYPMPPADRPVVAALTGASRLVITSAPVELREERRALVAGVRRVQLRDPGLAPADLRALAIDAAIHCRARGAEFFINGDIALAAGLGIGVQLKSSQLRGLAARPLPPELPVGASCHDADDLAHAERLGADFAVLGPVRATESHPDATPLGWDRFSLLREGVSLPIYAIGGMKPADLATARRHGAQGVAGIRHLWPR